jgi:hypothetical protein
MLNSAPDSFARRSPTSARPALGTRGRHGGAAQPASIPA